MSTHRAFQPLNLPKNKIITVDFYQTIEESLRLMKDHEVHHLVVFQNDQIFGVVSDRELYQTWAHFGIEKASLMSVGHSCTPSQALSPRSSLKDAVELMMDLKCSGLCVADKGRPLGVITTTDMVRFLYRSLENSLEDRPHMVDKSQVALSHPLMVNLMQLISEAGI
jgi:CBS domain-containing protein